MLVDTLGCVGSVFNERRDDKFVAKAGSDVEGRVSALVLAVNLGSCTTATTTQRDRTH